MILLFFIVTINSGLIKAYKFDEKGGERIRTNCKLTIIPLVLIQGVDLFLESYSAVLKAPHFESYAPEDQLIASNCLFLRAKKLKV